MSYLTWYENHAKKHKKIVDRVDKKELIDYFKWENISKTDVEFCPLFKDNRKCHDIENLNCYLCACPNFRFDDNADKIKSWCSINSKDGRQIEHNGVIHQDCSNCTIPHNELYIKKHFDTEWKMIMKDSPPKDKAI